MKLLATMKRFSLLVAMIALAFTSALAQNQLVAQKETESSNKFFGQGTGMQPGASGRQRQVLFDFRVTRRSNSLRIPMATQRNVLSKVFRRYLTDDSRCNPEFDVNDTDHLRAARNAGQIVPSIVDMAQGSFTGPLRQETLYVISVSECNASHAENFGSKRVAIFLGQQLIADMDVEFRSSIVRKTDLDGDGVDELLMTTGDINQGVLIEIGALVDFQKGRLRVIEDFGTVIEDSCASGFTGSTSKASVISSSNISPGRMPKLRIDNYEAGCRRVKRWRFVSTGKMSDD